MSTGRRLIDPSRPVNAELRRIWADTIRSGAWPATIPQRWPMQYPPLQSGRLLFVGLNPSASLRAERAGDDVTLQDVTELDDEASVQRRVDADALWRGAAGNELYPYFKPFAAFGHAWEHIDIFAVREGDQGKVREALRLTEPETWTAFAEQQFRVFEQLLETLEPIGVVIVNALGSVLLANRWEAAGCLEASGCEANAVLRYGGSRSLPVFFASMLSGARAMDRYSRARLMHDVQVSLHHARH